MDATVTREARLHARHTPWSVWASADIALSDAEHSRIAATAAALLRDEPGLIKAGVFGRLVSTGWQEGPSVFIEDHGEIALIAREDDKHFDYRSLGLAGNEDVILISRERHLAFETYLRDTIGLGAPEVLRINRPANVWHKSITAAACVDQTCIARLAAVARSAGTLNFVPYMTGGHIWRLAATIAERAGVPIQVSAPWPRLGRRANDKLWFKDMVLQCLGERAHPTTYAAFGPAAAAGTIRYLARHDNRVVLKVPSSAGSKGNLVFDAADIRTKSLISIRDDLLQALCAVGWRGSYPLLVSIWDQPVHLSPSAQMWIPDPCDGSPVLEGIFAQVLTGETAKFTAARPIALAGDQQEKFCREAFILASVLQRLGYYGRCSFDAVLVGGEEETAKIHWIECNARWGGVSIPLSIARRLVPHQPSPALHIVQQLVPDSSARFEEIIDWLPGRHFDRRTGKGIVFLSPLGQGDTILNFVSIAPTAREADALARETLARLDDRLA